MNNKKNNFSRISRARALIHCAMLSMAFACTTHPVSAATSGYVGMRAGRGDAGRDANLGSQAEGGAGEFFGGLRFDEHWAIELGFFGTDLDMGELPFFPDTTRDNNLKLRATTLSVRYDLPLGEHARVHLRGGIASFELDYKARFRFPSAPGSPPDNAVGRLDMDGSSMGGVLALGVDTAIGKGWRAGVELQHYRGDLKAGDSHGFIASEGFNRQGGIQVAMLSLSAEL